MSESIEVSTAISLAQARDKIRDLQVAAEMAALAAADAVAAVEAQTRKVEKLERILAILRDEVPPPITVGNHPPEISSKPAPAPAPVAPGQSVAEQVAARAAAGDELAQRSVQGGKEDRDAPPPINRNHGPPCPGCGTPGKLEQRMVMINGRGPFNAIVCTACGHQKASI
jgi:hypothetical protein